MLWGGDRRYAGAAYRALPALACLLIALLVATVPPAAAQRRQVVENEAHFHRVGPGGTEIQEKGTATGTYPGPISTHVVFSGNADKMTGTFALRTTGGTLTGRTNATAIGSTARPVVRYEGTATITGGTGRFRTASGTLKMFGTMRRINNAIYEKTTGRIHF